MIISIEVNNLTVRQLITILDCCDTSSSFLIKDYNKEYSFGELIKPEAKS